MRYWRDCLVCSEQAVKLWCFLSPRLVYLCVGLRRRWQERLPLAQGQPAGKWELLWVTGVYFTVYVNYFFGANRMNLLTSKENTLGFPPLCLTSLAPRILELGDARDRIDRGQSRPFDNQLFSYQRIIKRLWDIPCIWGKNTSQLEKRKYLLVPSIQP